MSTLKQLQGEVALRMRRGDTFTSVEAEVIDCCALSDDAKAALWLYGWSFVNWRRQRREAIAHIELLSARESPAILPDRRSRLAELSPLGARMAHDARGIAGLGAE
jgi:hypothetical protein